MSEATVKILYFAQVAELLNKREENWPITTDTTVATLLDDLCHHYHKLKPLKERLQVAVNHNHAQFTDLIQPNDEVAVFEPVTGG